MLRIYPAFAAAIALSASIWVVLQPPVTTTLEPGLNTMWADGVGPAVLLNHLSLRGRLADTNLDSVIWSLIYEMRISLIFPPLVFLALRAGPRMTALMAVAAALAIETVVFRSGIGPLPFCGADIGEALLATAHFTLYFVLGMLMALNLDLVRSAVARTPGVARLGLWMVAYLLFTTERFGDPGFGVASAIAMALALGSPASARALATAPLPWLGRVSYSLYLVHMPILAATLRLGGAAAPYWLLCLLAIVLSLGAAQLSFVWIERPANALGRRLAERIGRDPALATVSA